MDQHGWENLKLDWKEVSGTNVFKTAVSMILGKNAKLFQDTSKGTSDYNTYAHQAQQKTSARRC